MPSTTLSPHGPRVRLEEAGWWALTLVACLATARLTMASPQLGCATALVVLAVGAGVRSRAAGLTALWAIWLAAPLLRRLFAQETGYMNADPLALAPFVATAGLVAVELRRGGLPASAWRVPLLAGAGFLVGVPAGLAAPSALAFGLLAYVSAVGAFLLGYREGTRRGEDTLVGALRVGTPLLAGYAIFQYFALPSWDLAWLENTGLIVAHSPDPARVRVWSTLNAPGTFAMIMGLALVCFLAAGRFGPARMASAAAAVTALAFTYVRSAWVALAVAAAVLLAASRGRVAHRLAVVLAVAFVGIPALAAGTSTGEAIVARFETLGSLGSDTSAQDRQNSALELVPRSVSNPLGTGLGTASEPARLAPERAFRYPDSAYLSLLYQVGPLGFALVAAAGAAGMRRAWRAARRRDSTMFDLAVFGMLVFTVVGMLAGDLLYGITGVVFWYLLGVAWRRSEAAP